MGERRPHLALVVAEDASPEKHRRVGARKPRQKHRTPVTHRQPAFRTSQLANNEPATHRLDRLGRSRGCTRLPDSTRKNTELGGCEGRGGAERRGGEGWRSGTATRRADAQNGTHAATEQFNTNDTPPRASWMTRSDPNSPSLRTFSTIPSATPAAQGVSLPEPPACPNDASCWPGGRAYRRASR